MARALWKGAITFGLVTVPVGLYAAVDRRHDLTFRLLHARDASPIDYRRVCEQEGTEVPWEEIVRGYEYAKGQYVVLTDDDFEKARAPSTEAFEIRDFVPAGAVDARYFEHPYFLAPAGQAGVRGYALLRDALARSGRVGIGTIVLRQREHLAALAPVGRALVLTTMRFADEMRAPDELELPPAEARWDRREMDLALELIETLAADWQPETYRDTYREVLLQAIRQKVEGKEIEVPAPAGPPKGVDLVEALRESLRARRAPEAEPTRRGAVPKRRGRRRAA